MTVILNDLNHMHQKDFTESIGSVFEHSPWIAERAWHSVPFSSVSELHKTMVDIVKESELDKKLGLIRAHPDLANRVEMTSESVREQKDAGLNELPEDERSELLGLNEAYKEKFGFPFIMAVRGQNNHLIKTAMEQRIENDRDTEMETALQEIYKIAQFRLDDLIK